MQRRSRTMSDPSRLKFFKVFVETQSKERLRIPVYLMHMEGQKPQVFCLSGSSGDAWQVNLVEVLEKDSDELYFTHGWATFVKDNLIEHGHLLLFQYAGELNIKVEIFSRSGCPKEAAFHARCSQSKVVDHLPELDVPLVKIQSSYDHTRVQSALWLHSKSSSLCY
ncbi:B3 domain-containing protein Os11g0197600-like [Punica granatum]|uniref:B3 domain-containing protein Os11g0197600-like n=1 Tax=Punica granatum TaxID=22663 RepID=A0A6P8EHL0_PUNGR|nr:B3 domain-containing protein Os11g0197600-like [Punica granatum]